MKVILLSILMLSLSLVSYATEIPINKLDPITDNAKIEKDKVLIYFWASWCPDCKEKLATVIPDLAKNASDYSVITVNTDRKKERGVEFIQEENVKLPVYRDEEKQIAKLAKVFSVPSWAYLKKDQDKWMLISSSNGFDLEKVKKSMEIK
ncbi:MAG: TlpA family protein disulfide reductase [Oligoflexia bacterium]|nr:TlpA family protein disulfide reductase [Oligoflexia bacterium]